MMEQDTVQIDALDFEPDIDRPDTKWVHHTTAVVSVNELFTSPELNPLMPQTHKKKLQTGTSLIEDIPIQKIPIGLTISPNKFQTIRMKINSHDNNRSLQQTTVLKTRFDEIPQLEEDWKNGQFTDADRNLINTPNTHSESERIPKEYTEHLLDLTDNQYYSEEYPSVQLQYSILDQEYYRPQLRRSHKQQQDTAGYYPPPPDPADIQHWHAHGRGKYAFLHRHRLFGEKTHSAESR